MMHQKSYKGRYWVIETHGYYEKTAKVRIYLYLNNYVFCNGRKKYIKVYFNSIQV